MGSSFTLSQLAPFPNRYRVVLGFRHRVDFAPICPSGFRISSRRSHRLFSSHSGRVVEASWIQDGSSDDGCGGWAIGQSEIQKGKAVPKFLFVGIASSVAILIVAISCCYFTRKGFRYCFSIPFNIFQGSSLPSHSAKNVEVNAVEVNVSNETKLDDETNTIDDAFDQTKDNRFYGGKTHILVPVAADSTQKEALSILKNLKIVENDVKSEDLCTRRQYARWLVRLNSLLERYPNHRITPSTSIAGSTVNAFTDIGVEDPDFWYIQALGEAGIISSKLSTSQSSISYVDKSESDGGFKFSPESFISRLDLVDWKAQLEYLLLRGTEKKMSRKKVGFMDLGALTPDASPGLYMDMLIGDMVIARRVFGNSRRLQPHKPATIAQAAVALTSGRMERAIHNELSRLEAENVLRLAEMEDIRSDLIHRGEIHRFWEEKLNEEKIRGAEVQKAFFVALHDLEKERIARNVHLADYMKESAALDCQRHLLMSLKEEVDGMRDRLANERANFVAEQQRIEELFTDLRDRQDALFEAKSVLEAEKEALRILRSWVEEEARQSQLRVRVLEAAAQRWKWDSQSGLPPSSSSESGDKC